MPFPTDVLRIKTPFFLADYPSFNMHLCNSFWMIYRLFNYSNFNGISRKRAVRLQAQNGVSGRENSDTQWKIIRDLIVFAFLVMQCQNFCILYDFSWPAWVAYLHSRLSVLCPVELLRDYKGDRNLLNHSYIFYRKECQTLRKRGNFSKEPPISLQVIMEELMVA